MNFKEINSKDDIYAFFDERGIQPTPEDKSLFKIDTRHFLRLIVEDDLDRTIANNIKKDYIGKEEFLEHLLIIKSDFELFIFKKLYGDPDTVVYDKQKRYASDTEQSLLKKIDMLKFEDSNTSNCFYVLFDVREVVDKFYEEYRQLRDVLANLIVGTPEPNFLSQIILNRIIFIYFLQVKGIIPTNYLDSLYFNMNEGENFYNDYLELIFFELFNTEKDQRDSKVDEKFPKIPYLNGGLFSKFEGVEILEGKPFKIEIPNNIWKKIFILFNSYGWFIEEERGDSVSITPSVLGHIYEKSVVQKETGSYYTPKEITDYISKNTIYPFLTDRMNEKYHTNYENIYDILDKEDLSEAEKKQINFLYFDIFKNLSICDPACGSGAFLIAAEYVLFDIYSKCISILRGTSNFEEEEKEIKKYSSENYYIKLEIINNNIYGVDIQEGCIEIAKLRLWLSLISEMGEDIENIDPIPNIDFNIMVGNSLIGFVKFPKTKGKKIDDFLDKNISKIKELQKKKDEFRLEKSSRKSREIKNFIRKESKDIKDELNRILNQRLNLEIDLEPLEIEKIGDKKINVDIVKEKIAKINQDNELTKFKIICDRNNDIDVDEIKKHKGITCWTSRSSGKVTSIGVTPSFDFSNHHEGSYRRLSELIISLMDDWKYVKQIEFTKKLSVKDLKEFDPFHWVLEFYDVFERGGFDVIIGNPPYKRQEGITELKPLLNATYKTYNSLADLFIYFVERSIKIIHKYSYFSFILSQHWLRADYAKAMREHLLNHIRVKKIINFNEVKVFIGVGIGTIVFIFKKDRNVEKGHKFLYYKSPNIKNLEEQIRSSGYFIQQDSLNKISWIFYKPEIFEIKEYIQENKQVLDDLDIEINRGILTGLNEAFVINEKTKDRLIKEDQNSKELIKSVLRRKDIHRYYSQFGHNFLLFIKWDTNIDKYPAIKKHLKKYYNKLAKRPEVKENRFNWCCLSRYGSNYYTDFEESKLMWQEMSEEFNLFLDKSKIYCLKSIYIMTGKNLEILLLILNSALYSKFLIPLYIQEMSGGKVYLFGRTYVEKLPIKLPQNKRPFKILCNYMLFLNEMEKLRESQSDLIKFVDKQLIDSLIYEIYFKQRLGTGLLQLIEPILEDFKSVNSENSRIKIIKQTMKEIQNNKKILNEIKRIKNHRWVKIIEEMSKN
jgi:hypothetical protein